MRGPRNVESELSGVPPWPSAVQYAFGHSGYRALPSLVCWLRRSFPDPPFVSVGLDHIRPSPGPGSQPSLLRWVRRTRAPGRTACERAWIRKSGPYECSPFVVSDSAPTTSSAVSVASCELWCAFVGASGAGSVILTPSLFRTRGVGGPRGVAKSPKKPPISRGPDGYTVVATSCGEHALRPELWNPGTFSVAIQYSASLRGAFVGNSGGGAAGVLSNGSGCLVGAGARGQWNLAHVEWARANRIALW